LSIRDRTVSEPEMLLGNSGKGFCSSSGVAPWAETDKGAAPASKQPEVATIKILVDNVISFPL
jgi:hypothetical protein